MAIQGGQTGGGGTAGAIRAGAAYVELFLQDNKLTRGLDSWRQKLGSAGRTLFTAGAVTLGAGAAVAAPLLGLAAKTAASRVEMGRLAAKIGENVTTLSRFAYAAETTGLSLGDLEGGWENLSERIAQGASGAGEAGEAFKKLGINARSMLGMGRVEQMLTLADAFERITDATQRNAIQSGLGGDQFQKFNALFGAGRSQIEKLMREADEVGATQTEGQTRAATAAQLAWFRVKTAVGGAFKAVGDAILGPSAAIEDLADRVVNVVKAVRLFVQDNQGLVRGVFLTAVGVAAAGASLVGLGAGLSVAGTALGGLKAVIVGVVPAAKLLFAVIVGGFGLLLSPLGIFTAAVVGLGVLFVTQTEAGRGFAKDVGDHFRQTGENAKAAWGGIVDAVKAGDLQLAWGIATAALDLEWKRLWGEVKRVAREGWDFFGDGWDSAVYLVKGLWNEMTAGMGKAFVDMIQVVKGYLGDFARGPLKALAKLPGVGALAGPLDVFLDALDLVGPDKAKKAIDQSRDEKAKKIQAEYDLNKAVREAMSAIFRGNDAKAVADAEKKLADLRAQAARQLLDKERERKPPAALGVIGDGVRGMFNTFGLANQFGGTGDIPKRQLSVQQKMVYHLERIYDRIGGRDEVFA